MFIPRALLSKMPSRSIMRLWEDSARMPPPKARAQHVILCLRIICDAL